MTIIITTLGKKKYSFGKKKNHQVFHNLFGLFSILLAPEICPSFFMHFIALALLHIIKLCVVCEMLIKSVLGLAAVLKGGEKLSLC